jgi:hypothetical protein
MKAVIGRSRTPRLPRREPFLNLAFHETIDLMNS